MCVDFRKFLTKNYWEKITYRRPALKLRRTLVESQGKRQSVENQSFKLRSIRYAADPEEYPIQPKKPLL